MSGMTPKRLAEIEARNEWQPTHRHYKGGLYRYVGLARNSETGEILVIYQDVDGLLWARPRGMFSEIMPNGQRRFAPL